MEGLLKKMGEKLVKITAVGDIFLGEHPVTLGHGVNSVVKRKGCDFLFSNVKEHLNSGDIVCGNLEGIISPKMKNENSIRSNIFWGEPECAGALKSAGFNCLFLANNHTAQHGKDALKRTCDLLDENTIKWTGFNSVNPYSPLPALFQIRGVRVALVAYCQTQQYNLNTPILPSANFNNIKKDVDELRKNCDIIVVSLHWGDEFIDYPSPSQVQLARNIIDLGVHLVLGHHSHTMQGVEHYNSGLILYSLGSFVKDLWPLKLRESVILKCELSSQGIKDFTMVPIIINKHYQPEIYKGEAGKNSLKRVESLSKKIMHHDSTDHKHVGEQYLKDVKKLLIKDRIETLLHYILHIFQYDKRLLLKNMLLMLKRRISRKNI